MAYENDVLTKSEYKQNLIIEKLNQTVEVLSDKNKEYDVEIEKLSDKLDLSKQQNFKLTTTNESLMQKNSDLVSEHIQAIKEAQIHIDNTEIENEILHDLIFKIKAQILEDKVVLIYFGTVIDVILNEAYNNGLTILNSEYLEEKNFPLILLTELIDEEFSIATSNFKLLKKGDDYKLIKNSNNADKIEIQETKTN